MASIKDLRGKDQYIPHDPKKYVGKYPIIIRSSYERKFFQWCDANSSILEWSSESIAIQYFDPVKNKRRRYYPDVYMLVKGKDNKTQQFVIEIKPYKETHPPINRGRKTKKTLLWEDKTYATNNAKWKAAINWCSKMNMVFKIITERELFGK
jgi:hypothetical protein